ncbi:unnamed protein product [Orchesella dallaii]|uniref:Uncharacterized protein n=1 Tax=Orchesella dallaii TaxID=48710 RepID=A0ABP1RRX1_9HEXA
MRTNLSTDLNLKEDLPYSLRRDHNLLRRKKIELEEARIPYKIDWKNKTIYTENGFSYFIVNGRLLQEYDSISENIDDQLSDDGCPNYRHEPTDQANKNTEKSTSSSANTNADGASSPIFPEAITTTQPVSDRLISISQEYNRVKKPTVNPKPRSSSSAHQPLHFTSISQHHNSNQPYKRTKRSYENNPNYIGPGSLREKRQKQRYGP